MRMTPRRGLRAAAGALALAAGMVGCEPDRWGGHTPPAGQGSLIVDNRTAGDLYLYVDGVYTGRVDAGDDEVRDLAPGLRRAVLDEARGERAWRGDVDVLAGKRTVLEVTAGFADAAYDVRVYFD